MKPPYDVRGKSGIYCIIHKDSGMCYVGSSVDMEKRRRQHLREIKGTSQMAIHRAMRKLGIEAFDFEVLLECPKHNLLDKEAFYIALMNSASVFGFNTNSKPHARYDAEVDNSTRQRIAFTLRAKGIRPPSRKGITNSTDSNVKRSTTMQNRMLSDNHKRNLIKAAKNRSADHLAKVQAAKIGKPRSEECKAKIRAALSGRKLTPEHRAKVIKTLKHKKSANLAESGL